MNKRLNGKVPNPLVILDASQYNDWVIAGKWLKQEGYMIQSWSMWSGPWQKVHAPTQDDMVKIGTTSKRLGIKRIRYCAQVFEMDYEILLLQYVGHRATYIESYVLGLFSTLPDIPKLHGYSEFRLMSETDLKACLAIISALAFNSLP